MNSLIWRLFIFVVAFEMTTVPIVGQHFETSQFQLVRDRIEQLIERHPPAEVLFVVDVDNTLLAMNQPLGSDQWFQWQVNLLANHPESSRLVARDFEGILKAQGLLFAISDMHTPEPEIPALIEAIQADGCKAIVLTSRGDEFRNSTERELTLNGYDFDRSAILIHEQDRGPFAPFDIESPESHGLSVAEADSLGTPREISYANGLLMVAGQHKGLMLRAFLARTDQPISAICFVDDHLRHTERVQIAFADSEIEVVTIRYSREDKNVADFEQSDKTDVARDWRRLQRVFSEVLASPSDDQR